MLKSIGYRLLTASIPLLLLLTVVNCCVRGTEQGLHDVPYLAVGIVIADIAIAIFFYQREARRAPSGP